MASWVLTKGLESFRGNINARFPKRDKKSDGTIGDQTHASGTSGHNPDITGKAEYRDGDKLNEVRAWDMDSDLNDQYGFTAEQLVQYLIKLARSGAYVPFKYIIYKRRIWRKSKGWKTETYTGPSPHTEHVHFSGDFSQKADNYIGNLGIKDLGIPKKESNVARTLSDEDVEAIAQKVWLYAMADPEKPKGTTPETYDSTTAGAFLRFLPRRIAQETAKRDGRLAAIETTVNYIWKKINGTVV